MTRTKLQQLLDRFANLTIAVVGDFCLDVYLDIDRSLVEPSLETGRPAHQVVGRRISPGGAGTIVNNLSVLGAGQIHAVGAVGDDGHGWEIRRGLQERGCLTEQLVSLPGIVTPTYLKPREHDQPGLDGERERYDIMNRRSLNELLPDLLLSRLRDVLPHCDAVIVLDQVDVPDQGNITAKVRDGIAVLAEDNPATVFWADSRSQIRSFRQMITKPNLREATGIGDWNELELNQSLGTGIPDTIADPLRDLNRQTGRPVFLTCGGAGIIVSDPVPVHVPGVQVAGPVDVTGAGDSVTAAAVLSLAAGADPVDAALIGNLVASITIQQLAETGVAHPAEVVERFDLWCSQQDTDRR